MGATKTNEDRKMSEAKFTKGEWKASCVKVDGKEVRNGWGVNVYGATLASVYTGATYGVVHEQQKANAHLIAAAPEMYKHLEMLSGQLTNIDAHHAAKEIDELLAKARGEK